MSSQSVCHQHLKISQVSSNLRVFITRFIMANATSQLLGPSFPRPTSHLNVAEGARGLLTVVTIIFFLYLKYNRHRSKKAGQRQKNNSAEDVLNKLPSPKGVWFLGNICQLWNPKNRLKVWLDWCEQYGPCFVQKLMNHRIVILTSPEYVQKLFSSSEDAYLEKAYVYEALTPFVNDGILLSKAQKWRVRRKLLARAFTFQSLTGYMQVFNDESRTMVSELEQLFPTVELKNGENRKLPINTLLWITTLRVVCGSVLGTSIWESESAASLADCIHKVKTAAMLRLVQPWLLNKWLFALHPKSNVYKKTISSLETFTRKMIKLSEKKGENKGKEKDCHDVDLPPVGGKQRFTSMIEEMRKVGIEEDGILEECQNMITAGYETTATSLQFLFFLLALHPEHQEACRKEVDAVFEDSSLCPGGDLTFDALSHLKHLERCVLETMRLFPVAFMFVRKIEAPLKLDENLTLPPNTNVGVYVPGIHRNPNIYPDPNAFKPERFLQEEVKQRNVYAFMSFSAGPRNCIGYKFGMANMRVITAHVLRNFIIRTEDRLEDVALLAEIVLMPERPYNFTFTKRSTV